MPAPGRPLLISIVAGAVALAACSSDGPTSQTPRITDASEAPPSELFLRADDLSLIAGFEGAEARELSDVSLFENPDPRGPCGAVVRPPPTDDLAGRVIRGPTLGLTQYVSTSSEQHRPYLDALIADGADPCEPYRAVTNTGDTQTVTETTVFELAGEGVDGVGWTSRVDLDGDTAYVGTIAVEADGVVSYVQVQSLSPIPVEGMQLVSEATVLRLQSG